MKFKIPATLTCMFALLLISSLAYAVTVPVSVNSQGITFPDNTIQQSAAILPVCLPGEVYANIAGAMVCSKIVLIPNGIATCYDKACSVSSCMQGFVDCNTINQNCDTSLNTITNCGGCGILCNTVIGECWLPACLNGTCDKTPVSAGSPCSGGTCDESGACNHCGNGTVSAGEQCDDGNKANGDGCSSSCSVETGFQCTGQPSECIPIPQPSVLSISPNEGLATSTTENVVIQGTNFSGTTIIKIGAYSLPAGSCIFNSSTSITCTIPISTIGVGLRDVTANNSGVTGTLTNGWRYIGVLTNGSFGADYCILQHPMNFLVSSGSMTPLIYGRVYEPGMTEQAGSNPNIKAQVGYGPNNSDPTTHSTGWTYVNASFNVQVNTDDEYAAQFTAPSQGTYSYVYRFTIDNGANYTFCDTNGGSFSAAWSGMMTVN